MSLWSCASCSKSFTRKGDLTRHELLHTGIKPHVCKTCGKGFAQLSGLKTHWNVHSKAKPYICGIGTCKKAFGDPSSRARHRKETHRREGAYKCVVSDCGTRIKRRSAFVAHLRKHGIDPSSVDIGSIVSQSSEEGIAALTHFASPDVENKRHDEVPSRSVFPSFLNESSGYHNLTNHSVEASHSPREWLGDHLLDYRQDNIFSVNNAYLAMFDEAVNVGLGIPDDDYAYLSRDIENLFYVNTFPAAIDHSFLTTSALNYPVLESFLEAGTDGSQSPWSSPSSTYSTLYNDASQESLLYNMM